MAMAMAVAKMLTLTMTVDFLDAEDHQFHNDSTEMGSIPIEPTEWNTFVFCNRSDSIVSLTLSCI